MPYRIVTSFRPLSFVGAAISFAGAMDADKVTAWIGATTAIGAVLVPTLLDWHRKIRQARREERAADVVLDSELRDREVRKQVELEGRCERLRLETSENRHRIASQQQTIVFLQAQLDALKRGVKKLDTEVDSVPVDVEPGSEPGPPAPATS